MANNDELRRLGNKLEALKDASMFNARECGVAVIDSTYRVLCDFNLRLQRLEKKND